MHVDLKRLAVASYQSLTRVRFSFRRLGVVLSFLMLFLPFEIWTWLCLKFDDLFFRGYRKVRVVEPVFIVGNPRSGTSFFHRLMAVNDRLFAGFCLHHIVFPAISQQRLLRWLGKLDRRLGSPGWRLVARIERSLTRESDKIRRVHLTEPEEDEMVLVHAFATSTLLMLFPGAPILVPLIRYDELDEKVRKPIERFYVGFLKRRLYLAGGNRRLLSKNTTFPTKIRSIRALFPDARFIYLIRNPTVSIASTHDMFDRFWQLQFDRDEITRQRQRLLETTCYLYQHALEELDQIPDGSKCIVQYEDLVTDPAGTVERVYRTLGLPPMDEEVRTRLDTLVGKARGFKTRHQYSLASAGLTEQAIQEALPEVYSRFRFQERLDT